MITKHKIGEYLTLIINHEAAQSVFSISYFILSGMKDDIRYFNGTAHLTEHLLAQSLFCADNPFIFANAYVDKEHTCFYGQTFSPYFNQLLYSFLNLFRNLQVDSDSMDTEKQVIAHVENRKTASNHQLLDLEKLEYYVFSENDGLHMPTLILENSFFRIDNTMVRSFIFNELSKSKKYLVISGEFSDSTISRIVKSVTEFGDIQNEGDSILLCDEELKRARKQNNLQIEEYKPKHCMTGILLKKVDSIKEWFALNILCVFYQTYINNFLRKTRNHLIDLAAKQYENACILIFYYFADFENTMDLLYSIELGYFSELLISMKRTFLFPFMEKIINPLEYHKLQFKSICFNRADEILQSSKVMEVVDSITPEYIVEIHNKCLNGKYYDIAGRRD